MSRGNVPPYTAEPKVGYFNLKLLNPELYNINEDPEEATDLSGQHPDVVRELQTTVLQLLPTLPAQVQNAWRDTESRKVYPNEAGGYPVPILP
jgi:hypothetical protein